MKSKIMNIANRIRKYVGGLSNALKLAWKIVKCEFLKKAFTVSFTKISDGSKRVANIVSIDLINIEKDYVRFTETIDNGLGFAELQSRTFKFSTLNF